MQAHIMQAHIMAASEMVNNYRSFAKKAPTDAIDAIDVLDQRVRDRGPFCDAIRARVSKTDSNSTPTNYHIPDVGLTAKRRWVMPQGHEFACPVAGFTHPPLQHMQPSVPMSLHARPSGGSVCSKNPLIECLRCHLPP